MYWLTNNIAFFVEIVGVGFQCFYTVSATVSIKPAVRENLPHLVNTNAQLRDNWDNLNAALWHARIDQTILKGFNLPVPLIVAIVGRCQSPIK